MAPSDQKVTIVLNSHNRPATLLRILGTIVQHYKNINILIVDSSELSKREEIERFANQNMDPGFVKICTFSETTPVFNKLLVAANSVATQYIQYFADDDSVCPDTIIDRLDFLENNGDFSACLGRQYYCNKTEADYSIWFEFQGQQDTFCNENPIQRLEALSKNWVSFSYATLRTDVAKKAFKLANDVDPEGNFFGERILYMAILICGKVKLLDVPSICLSVHKGTKSEGLLSLDKTIFEKNSSIQYRNFETSLSQFIQETIQLEETNARQLGEWFISRHLAFWILAPIDQPHSIKEGAFKLHLEYVADYAAGLSSAIEKKTDMAAARNAFLTGKLHNESEKMLDILSAKQ